MIPDLDVLAAQLANQDPNWITITFRGIGEMRGDKATAIPNRDDSWINLSPYESDEFGVPRAYVQITLGAAICRSGRRWTSGGRARPDDRKGARQH